MKLITTTAFLSLSFCCASAQSALLYESGTLGQTGIPWTDLTDGSVPSAFINTAIILGVRFELDEHVVTSEISGHFGGDVGGTFYGAIVQLDDEDDFPDSSNLSTPDVLGHTLLIFPVPSDEVFGDLVLPLDPGWYALLFGTGLFETTAIIGGAVRNGVDIAEPDYIGRSLVAGWFNMAELSPTTDNFRYVINGTVVPEPNPCVLAMIATLCLLFGRRHVVHHVPRSEYPGRMY